VEDGFEAGFVVVGVVANELDDFSVAVGGLAIVTSGLVDHAEAIPAVVDIGEALEQIAGDLLGFIELVLIDEVDGGVGSGGEFVLGVEPGEAVGDFHVNGWSHGGGRERASAASCCWRQQCLYFLPLPHGQGSLRLILAISVCD
jgi:hypothetical protein